MDIGEEQAPFVIEPIVDPVPAPRREPALPARERDPVPAAPAKEPVPA